jgi:hypothetical protein
LREGYRALRALAIARGKSEAEVAKVVAVYSSHSMRAGYATTAGDMAGSIIVTSGP